MGRKEELLDILKKRGEQGISSKEIAKRFKYNNFGSGSKLIYQLRRLGHHIEHFPDRGVYVFHDNSTKKIKKEINTEIVEEAPEQTPETVVSEEDSTPKKEKNFVGTKKDYILQLLIEKDKEGASAHELASLTGIKIGTISYHIHSLRKREKLKIVNINGRYILKSKKVPFSDNFSSLKAPSENPELDKLLDILNDRELINGFKSISPEDMESYLNLIKNVAYYRQCALNLVNTSKIISGFKMESILS
jgi:DNA-binding transcriptional ArsR family regulator